MLKLDGNLLWRSPDNRREAVLTVMRAIDGSHRYAQRTI